MKSNFGKKGAITDPITVGAVILTIAITAFIMIYIWTGFSSSILVAVADSPANETVTTVVNELTVTYSWFDYMVPLIVGGLMIVSLILAYKTGAGIIYAFWSFIVWGLGILFANVYQDVFTQFELAFPTTALQFPILVFLFDNYNWIILAWLFLIGIVMFTRTKKEDAAFNSGMQQYYQ